MLTQVILDGPMGRHCGREWNLAVRTPSEALSLIEANKPGVMSWIRNNRAKYANYRVTITGRDGKKQKLDNSTYGLQRNAPKVIRFTPITQGASAVVRTVVGAALLAVAYFFPVTAPYLVPMGISLMIGGIVEMLSPQPKQNSGSSGDSTNSYYFNGPTTTTNQGVPVPLIYGKVMTGGTPITAAVQINQLM